MKIRKLLSIALLGLFLSPLASADELGTGFAGDDPRVASRSLQPAAPASDAPSASDELGTGSSVASATTWWEYLLQMFR